MAEKKMKKGLALWIVIGAVALAGLGVGGFFLAKNLANKPAETTEAPTTEEPTTEDVDFGDYQVFWNIDRDEYNGQSEIGLSSRTPDPTDGYYHILFAVDGRSVIRLCADKSLVNKLEVERAMGLKFDDQGFIVDVIKIDEFTGGYAYDGMYVTSASETGELVLNSSALLDGMDFDAEFAENARVFDVSGALYDPGMEIRVADINPRDRVVCINDKEGKVAYVYVTSRFITEPLYFNVERKYDSAIATTTREPNKDGLYEFLLAVNGEQKMFYTRSRTVATDIDKNSNFIVGLHFDEEGLITEVYAATKACGGGGYFGSWHWVEQIAGNQLSVARYSDDTHVTGTLSPDCRVFDVSGLWGFKGMEVEASSLNYWDQIIGFLDADKQIKYVFIMYRHVDGEVVFVRNKQYDSKLKVTKRVPDANGNYWYEVESGGTLHNYRVTDKDLATEIDGGASYIGIDLEGDRITKVYPARSRTGNYATGGGYTITEVLGDGKYMTTLISTTSTSAGATKEITVEPDAVIVNMSTRYTSNIGEYTTLRLGDRIYPILDPYLKASYVFITSRIYPGFDVYARVSRQYNTTTKETTRKPDDEGFYNIPVSYHGKQMVLKTKDKAVATKIDAVSVPYLAIAVNGTTPYNADTVSAAWAAVGGVPGGYYYVTKKSGNTVTLRQYDDDANPGASSGFTMAADCEVYNIGGEFNVFGEATTIRVGDRVAAMIGTDSLAHLVYVVGRKGTVITKNCPVCGKEVQWTSFGGTFKAGVTHYYLAGDRTTVTQANTVKDLEVHFDLNGKTWMTEDGVRSLALYNENSTVRIFDTSKAKTGTIKPKKGAAAAYGACLWLRYGSDKLYIDDVLLDFSAMDAENGYGAIWGPSNSYIELNNVRIKAGHTQFAAAVGSAGELVLNNVEITGGTVEKYGSIYIPSPGVLTLKGNVTVTGGTRTDDGSNANIFLAKGRKLNIDGELTSAEGAIGIRMDSEDVFTGPDCAAYASAFVSDLPGGTIVTASGDALAIRFALSGIAFEEESISVAAGEAATVVVNQLPSPIEGTVITLTSADESKVRISAGGQVIGVAETGEDGVLITASTGEFTATCKVIVTEGTISEHYHAENAAAHIATDEAKVNWTKWEATDSLPLESGYYYLDADVTLAETAAIPAGQDIHICLNGHTVTGSDRLVTVGIDGAAAFSVCDCSEGEAGQLVAPSEPGDYARAVYVAAGTFNFFGGKMVGGEDNMDTRGGGSLVVNNKAIFNMYGGTITGGKSTGARRGGNIHVTSGGTMNLYGGTIADGSTVNDGAGNVYVEGTFNMYDGVIKNGIAGKYHGGNLYGYGNVNIYGGTIENGTAPQGGNVALMYGSFKMTGGEIKNGTVSGVWVGSANVYIYGVENAEFLGGTVVGKMGLLQAPNVVLGGDFKLANESGVNGLYLHTYSGITEQNVRVAEGGFSEGANIYVTMTRNGTDGLVAVDVKEEDVAFFKCDSSLQFVLKDYEGSTTGKALYLVEEVITEEHKHCVCGGALEGTEGHTCEEALYTPWTSATTLPTASGKYYLTKDITLSAQVSLTAGTDVTICLNGHTVHVTGTRAALLSKDHENMSLTITDCKGTGKFVQEKSDNGSTMGGLFLLYGGENSKMDIYGGTFAAADGTTATGNGALINVFGKSTLNMYGGTVENGHGASGGNIFVDTAAALNMYGGTIRGGSSITSGTHGGNVHSKGTFNMYGGSIEDGVNTSGSGGNVALLGGTFTMTGGEIKGGSSTTWLGSENVYVYGPTSVEFLGGTIDGNVCIIQAPSVTLGGDIKIANDDDTAGLFLYDYEYITAQVVKIAEEGFKEGAKVLVSATRAGTDGLVALDAKEADLAFFAADRVHEVVLKDNTDSSTSKAIYLDVKTEAHKHCVCNGALEGAEGHTCEEVEFTAWSDPSTLPTTTGKYYLTTNVTLSAQQQISANTDVVLCLNGFTVKSPYRAYYLLKDAENISLTITDCAGTGKIASSNAGAATLMGGLFLFFGGENSVVNFYGGTFEMPEGYLSSSAGGMVNMMGKNVVNIYGGTFQGGVTSSSGGNFYVDGNSELNVYGGTIQNGVAGYGTTEFKAGGNIGVGASAKLNVYGGTIKGGVANYGGNIYSNGAFTMSGGDVLNGAAVYDGGNIYLNKSATSMATITGGTITDGTAARYGGNIVNGIASPNSLTLGGTLTITGGKVGEDDCNIRTGADKPITVLDGFAPTSPVGIKMGTAGGVFTANAADVEDFTSDTPGFEVVKLEDGRLELKSNVTLDGVTLLETAALSYEKRTMTLKAEPTPAGAQFTKVTWASDDDAVTVEQSETDPLEATITLKDADKTATITVTVDDNFSATCAVTTTKTHSEADHEGWTAWDKTDALPTYKDLAVGDNYFYLTEDVVLTASWQPGRDTDKVQTDMGGRKLTLCLNGHTVTGPTTRLMTTLATSSAPYLHTSNIDLTITDCNETPGKLLLKEDQEYSTTSGLMFWLNGTNGKLTLVNVTLDANGASSTSSGALISGNQNAEINIYDATLIGGATKTGGAVYLATGATLNLYSGTIQGGEVTAAGGNIYVESTGIFNMYGGKVVDGKAPTGNAGNLAVRPDATANLYNGEISGGSAKNGGGIAVYQNGTLNIDATAEDDEFLLKDNTATVTGGNLWIGLTTSTATGLGTATIKGATISGGTVYSNAANDTFGGNVYSRGELIMEDCVIADGRAVENVTSASPRKQGYGGNFHLCGGTAEITKCEIRDGRAAVYAGNIFLAKISDTVYPTVTITDTDITGGYAWGGGAITVSDGELTLAGKTKVTGATYSKTADDLGNVLVRGAGHLTLKDEVQIVDNFKTEGTEHDLAIQGDLKIDAEDLTGEAMIGVVLTNGTGVFTNDLDADYSAFFKSTVEGFEITYDENKLSVTEIAP